MASNPPARSPLRQAALTLALMAVATFAVLAGREALRLGAISETSRPAETPTASSQAVAALPGASMSGAAERGGPGPGIVFGRLIDGQTGLPVRDGGMTLLELGRRTITLPDGQFRFDSVPPGAYTLVAGPAEGYVPASRPARVLGEGADLGFVALLPAAPPVVIEPAFGGRITACGGSQLLVPSDALVEASALQLTCIGKADGLPTSAPAGRLPLAAVDLAPGELAMVGPARLVLDLPVQPRYSAGVTLDLLRLDLDRLIWTPSGSLTVDEGGRSASGDILALGTYLAAAPPFGTFMGSPGEGPALTRINTALRPAGEPVEAFPAGSAMVFLSYDYARMQDTVVRVRTVDAAGDVLFEHESRHEGEGREDLAMLPESGAWPSGPFVSTLYVGQPAEIRSISWSVGLAPAADPAAPVVSYSSDWSTAPLPAAPALPVAGCPVPVGWYAYTVQAGDTLTGIAARTGTAARALASANCLPSERILAGQALYVPTIVWRNKPPLPAVVKPPLPPAPTRQAGPGAPGQATSAWYTPAPESPWVKATRPPDPTLAPRPVYPTPQPAPWQAPPLEPAPAPQPSPDLTIRRQPEPGLPPPPKDPRPPDPTLAPRPTDPPLP